MFMFFHALVLAFGLFGGLGGGFTHFGGAPEIGAPTMGPPDGGGSMPGPGSGLPGGGNNGG